MRPTGIIRTLPSLYSAEYVGAKPDTVARFDEESIGARRYHESIELLEAGRLPAIYIALQCVPRIDVLHIYLLIDGEIRVRLNIAGYLPGDARKCWDESIRTPKIWAECTAPVSRPPEPMRRRGFQGIRYTEELW